MPADTPTRTPQLPTELWIQILRHIDQNLGLLTLCHTSRLLRRLALPLAFRAIDLQSVEHHSRSEMDKNFKFKVLKPLQAPWLAANVTDFRVALSAWHMCHKYGRPRIYGSSDCSCDAIDRQLGDSLVPMINLQTLDIQCLLCTVFTDQRHRYIMELKTRNLRIFSFRCYCLRQSHALRERVLSSSVLATVQVLRWQVTAYDQLTDSLGEILDDMRTLPSLSALYYHGTAMDNKLLATRPIKRLAVYGAESALEQALSKTPAAFTHVIVDDLSRRTQMLLSKSSMFTELQHIGTIPMVTSNDASNLIELLLALYQPFPHLASLDAVVPEDEHPWNPELLSRLRTLHPNLRRVLCRNESYFAWLFNGESWERQDIQEFLAWDIINGACDHI